MRLIEFMDSIIPTGKVDEHGLELLLRVDFTLLKEDEGCLNNV